MVGAVHLLSLLLLFLPQSMSSGAFNTTECLTKSCFVPGICDQGKLEKLRLSRTPDEECPFGLIVEVKNSTTWTFRLYSTQSDSPMVLKWNDRVVNCSLVGTATVGNYSIQVSSLDEFRQCVIEVRNKNRNIAMKEIFTEELLQGARLEILVAVNKTYIGEVKSVMEELIFRTPIDASGTSHCENDDVCFAPPSCNSSQLVQQNTTMSGCQASFSVNAAKNFEWKVSIIAESSAKIEKMEFKWSDDPIFVCNTTLQEEKVFKFRALKNEEVKTVVVISHIPSMSTSNSSANSSAKCTFTIINSNHTTQLLAWIVRNSNETTEMQLVIHSEGMAAKTFTGLTDHLKRNLSFKPDQDRCDTCDMCHGESCVLGDGVILGDGNCIQYKCDPGKELFVNDKFFAINITCEHTRWIKENNQTLPATVLKRIECRKTRDCRTLHPLTSFCAEGEDKLCHTLDSAQGSYNNNSCAKGFRLVYRTKQGAFSLRSINCNEKTGDWSVMSSVGTTIRFPHDLTTIACLKAMYHRRKTSENEMKPRDLIFPEEDETIGMTVGLSAAGIVVGFVVLLGLIAAAGVFITCKKLRPETVRSAPEAASVAEEASNKEKNEAAPTIG